MCFEEVRSYSFWLSNIILHFPLGFQARCNTTIFLKPHKRSGMKPRLMQQACLVQNVNYIFSFNQVNQCLGGSWFKNKLKEGAWEGEWSQSTRKTW